MSRWFGYVPDAAAGGTTLDTLAADPIPTATTFVPVTTANADPNTHQVDRNNLVTGVRGQAAPVAFASDPRMTFETLAFAKFLRQFLPKAMGGSVTPTGVAPAAVHTVVEMAQSGVSLPAIIGTLIREGQADRMTGLWLNSLECNFPVDAEGTVNAELWGLYHEVDPTASIAAELPAGSTITAGYDDAYLLRDINAIMGDGAGVPIDCLAGFGFTVNNNLIDDFKSRFCAGKNIWEDTLDTVLHRLWYPNVQKLGPQTITGRLDFGDVKPDRELRRILTHCEKLVVELTAGPLATTPAADEMARLTFYKQAPTGGGADPLQRDGDQTSSYEFTAYVDPATGKDLEVEFISTAAVTLAD